MLEDVVTATNPLQYPARCLQFLNQCAAFHWIILTPSRQAMPQTHPADAWGRIVPQPFASLQCSMLATHIVREFPERVYWARCQGNLRAHGACAQPVCRSGFYNPISYC